MADERMHPADLVAIVAGSIAAGLVSAFEGNKYDLLNRDDFKLQGQIVERSIAIATAVIDQADELYHDARD